MALPIIWHFPFFCRAAGEMQTKNMEKAWSITISQKDIILRKMHGECWDSWTCSPILRHLPVKHSPLLSQLEPGRQQSEPWSRVDTKQSSQSNESTKLNPGKSIINQAWSDLSLSFNWHKPMRLGKEEIAESHIYFRLFSSSLEGVKLTGLGALLSTKSDRLRQSDAANFVLCIKKLWLKSRRLVCDDELRHTWHRLDHFDKKLKVIIAMSNNNYQGNCHSDTHTHTIPLTTAESSLKEHAWRHLSLWRSV